MKEMIIGIDLGTTNSAVACVRDGQPRILPIDGSPTMPSCVGLSPDGELLVGREALNQFAVYPERTVRSIKRRMGLDYQVTLGDQSFGPEEISALILKKLKAAAEEALGQPVSKAVVTVPAYFDENQRKATRQAGELAGLQVERILNEPTAAALAYGADRRESEKVLVYDLGGGTFDASLVVSENGVIEVKSSHGDTQLGGDDFDQVLVRRAARSFVKEGGSDPLEDPVAHNRLKLRMEAAKIHLSSNPFVQVEEAFFHEGKNLALEVTREEYEEEIRPLLDKTVGCCAQCLHDAAIRGPELDRILLVGGASRTPLVQALIEERLGLEPRHEIDPDLIVAYGAALQGAALAGEPSAGILVDITPYNLGISALSGPFGELGFSTIIRRNTPLPVSRSELFRTATDNQPEVIIMVYQGETENLEGNRMIGEFVVEGLSKAPAGDPILVHFQLNLNGMLEVTATEKRTGLSKTVELDTGTRHGIVDLTASKERLGALAGDEDASVEGAVVDNMPPSDAGEAETLRERADHLLELDSIDADDRAELLELRKKSNAALEAGDREALAALNNALEDLLFYLED